MIHVYIIHHKPYPPYYHTEIKVNTVSSLSSQYLAGKWPIDPESAATESGCSHNAYRQCIDGCRDLVAINADDDLTLHEHTYQHDFA
jgi:hypothetical protein